MGLFWTTALNIFPLENKHDLVELRTVILGDNFKF
jgi:hypothetical protein